MTPEHEVPHVVQHRKGPRAIDSVMALSAVAISLMSLAVSIHHGSTMREMADANRQLVTATSWPLLQYDYSNGREDGRRAIEMVITNAGVGPAKIRTLEVSCKGQVVRNAGQLLKYCAGYQREADRVPLASHSTFTGRGTVLRAGESAAIIALRDLSGHEQIWTVLNGMLDNMTVRACYCSVFNECWTSDLVTLEPEPVLQCPKAASMFGAGTRK